MRRRRQAGIFCIRWTWGCLFRQERGSFLCPLKRIELARRAASGAENDPAGLLALQDKLGAGPAMAGVREE
jgi:hypothetical protein